MTIGELIKERRMEMNMTQMELADTVGTTTATISRWESGDIRQMKRDMIEATASALRIPKHGFSAGQFLRSRSVASDA